jgi:phosphoglycolate phosphatase-like HAD superfamily hydrolase
MEPSKVLGHFTISFRRTLMNNELAAIVFDVEGTLIDCVPHVLESWQRVLAANGHGVGPEILQRYSGMDGYDMLDRLLPNEPKKAKKLLLHEQSQCYRREYLERARPFDGVHTCSRH